MSAQRAEPPQQPRSPGELFRAFSSMALQGFGGVLPVAQRELVERRRWLTPEGFVESLALAQVLPGPNVVNLALMIGDRAFGLRGAFAALAGMLAAPLAIVLLLAALYARFAHLAPVAGALRGMGAVAAGLVLATAFKLLPTLRSSALGAWPAAAIAAAAALALGLLRWPMLPVLAGLGAAGAALALRRLR